MTRRDLVSLGLASLTRHGLAWVGLVHWVNARLDFACLAVIGRNGLTGRDWAGYDSGWQSLT